MGHEQLGLFPGNVIGDVDRVHRERNLLHRAIVQFQAITARVLDPRDPAVVTVGAINAGVENNTIPGIAELKLNFRFFDDDVRQQLFDGVKSIGEGIARTDRYRGRDHDHDPQLYR